MSAGSDDRPDTHTRKRTAIWLSIALAAATSLWTGAVFASLHWRSLDRFLSGYERFDVGKRMRRKQDSRRARAPSARAALSGDTGHKSADHRAIWGAVALTVVTVAWIVAMIASLEWGFLDRFCVGTCTCRGIDLLGVPRGYDNLLHGKNIYLTEFSHFGGRATAFLAHPFMSVAIGSWAFWIGAQHCHYVFVCFSLALLALSAWLLASVGKGPAGRAFACFSMFFSAPIYLMLWAGQLHVLVILSVSLILVGLIRLAGNDPKPKRSLLWIQAGILVSLLSKPVTMFMLPVLLVTRETRKWTLPPVAVYAVISLIFLLVPALNPGGLNGAHWINMIVASSTPKVLCWAFLPVELDASTNFEIYSVAMLLQRTCGQEIAAIAKYLAIVVILVLSLTPLAYREQSKRLRAAVVVCCLAVLLHYLAYYAIFEYQYATTLPLLAVHVWLWRGENRRGLRRLLKTGFTLSLLVFVPTLNFVSPTEPSRFWLLNALMRVVPVVIDFLCLAFYGAATAWSAMRRREFRGQGISGQMRSIAAFGGTAAAILGVVLLAVYGSSPSRMWKNPRVWTRAEWIAHLEPILRRDGRSSEEFAEAETHRVLGEAYTTLNLDESLRHYNAAFIITRDPRLIMERGDALVHWGRYREAMTNYAQIAKAFPKVKIFQERLVTTERLIEEQNKPPVP
jgi:hypothetical protein